MGLVVGTAVVVVNAFLRRVIVEEEVVVDLAPSHTQAGRSVVYCGEVGLAVPRVERAMIARFSACGEHEVGVQIVATTEAIVEIDTGPRPVEEDIPRNDRLRSLGLHVEAALLFIEANLPG